MAVSEAREDVKLLGHWASPFVAKVAIALNLKGVRYQLLEEEIGSKGGLVKSELLLKSNPVYKKIPVLIHDGKPICESMIIVQYIDEVWSSRGASILPYDPNERAVARFWSVYADEWVIKLFVTLRATTEEAKAKAAEEAIAGLQVLEEAFKECSKGKSFFGADSIGYVDIALGCSLGWIGAAEELCGVRVLDEAKTPQLVGWAERFLSDDAVMRAIPEVGKFVEFGKMMLAGRNVEPAAN